MSLRVLKQLTPLQFYYNLQTESQRAAAAAAAAADVVLATSETHSSDSSCRPDVSHEASGARSTTQSSWKQQRRRSLVASAYSDSKVAETATASAGKLQKRKQEQSKAKRRHSLTKRDTDDKPTVIKDDKDESAAAAVAGDERKPDVGSVGERLSGETEERQAVAEKKCCGDDDGKTGCAFQAATDAGKNKASCFESRLDEGGASECSGESSSTGSKSLTSTSPTVALSKLKIFKCSESKKLCVRPSAEPSEQNVVPPATEVPKLCLSKNLVARRSGGLPVVDVARRKNDRDDDKRERRRRRRRRREEQAKRALDPLTLVDRSVTEVDQAALSPDPPEDRATDAPPVTQTLSSPVSSPRSGSNDNVVSSSTSSRLLPDDDDDEEDAARRALSSKTSRPRRTPGDGDDVDYDVTDEGKQSSADQSAGEGDSAATTLRVPIRLGGQSGLQTGELLLRLPQNVSVQCSFRADQILIASSPATTSSERSTLSTGAGVAPTAASSDTDLLASSQQHVSDVYALNYVGYIRIAILIFHFCLAGQFSLLQQ